MGEIQVNRFDTAAPVGFTLDKNGGVTGATIVVAVRDAATSNSWLDFDDLTFKTSAWATRQATLGEVSASNAPGVYELTGGLDIRGITNLPAATDVLFLEFDITAGGKGIHTDRMDIRPYTLDSYDHEHGPAIYFDSAASNTGIIRGVDGTLDNPVSTEAALFSLSTLTGICTFAIRTSLVMGAVSYNGKTLIGDLSSGATPTITVTGANSFLATTFIDTLIIGTMAGTPSIKATRCEFRDLLNVGGEIWETVLGNTIKPTSFGSVYQGCSARESGLIVDLSGSGSSSNEWARISGGVTITGLASASFNGFDFTGGAVTISDTCTAGTIRLSGVAKLTDNSGPGCTVDVSGLVQGTDTALARKHATNKITTQGFGGTPVTQTVYEDDGTTVLATTTLTTDAGTPVQTRTGVQTNRTKFA